MNSQYCDKMHCCLQMNRLRRHALPPSISTWEKYKKWSRLWKADKLARKFSWYFTLARSSLYLLALNCPGDSWEKPIFCMKSYLLIRMEYFCMISSIRSISAGPIYCYERSDGQHNHSDRGTQGGAGHWCPPTSGLFRALHHLVPPSAKVPITTWHGTMAQREEARRQFSFWRGNYLVEVDSPRQKQTNKYFRQDWPLQAGKEGCWYELQIHECWIPFKFFSLNSLKHGFEINKNYQV